MPRKQRNDGLMNEHQLKTQRLRAKRVITVTDLLTRDDVNGILDDLSKRKDKITSMIVITLDKDKISSWQITDETTVATAVWMLESTKFDLLNTDCEE